MGSRWRALKRLVQELHELKATNSLNGSGHFRGRYYELLEEERLQAHEK